MPMLKEIKLDIQVYIQDNVIKYLKYYFILLNNFQFEMEINGQMHMNEKTLMG